MKIRLLLAALLFVATTVPTWADLVIEESSTGTSGSQAEKVTIYVSADRLAVNQGTTGMIYLAKKDLIWQYDTAKSMYIELTPQNMKQLKQKTDSLVAEQIKSIKEQRSGMSEEEKAIMQKALDQLQHGDSYSYQKIGAEKKVNGWSCTPIQVMVNGEPDEQMCVAPLKELGITASDMQVFDSLEKFYRNLGEGRSAQIVNLPGLEKFLGYRAFPVEEILTSSPSPSPSSASGKEVLLVQSIKHQAVPDSAFVLPQGLTKQSLFGLP